MPLHAVPDGRPRRTAESILADILTSLASTHGSQLDPTTAVIHPARGRAVTLALHYKTGETWFIDAYPADQD